MTILLYALTAVLYGGLALVSWHRYCREAASTGGGTLTRGARSSADGVIRAALLAALVTHGVLLHQTIFRADSMHFGFAYALSAMLWLSAGIYWIESYFFRIDSVRLMVTPAACLASVMPLVFHDNRILPFAANPMFKLHFVIANMAYGLFALAALHALLMISAERHLHPVQGSEPPSSWLSHWFDTLPPLLTMEKLLFRMITAGFVLLTLTLVSGAIFSEELFGEPAKFDHKNVFAVISWLMFGAVLAGRRWYGWRGKTALRWVLVSFVSLLLAYIGTRFVLEVLLNRAAGG